MPEEKELIRITLDTNFYISALNWSNSYCHKLLIKLIQQEVSIFITNQILDEVIEVLERDFNYNNEELNEVKETIISFANLVEPNETIDHIKEDKDDNAILECGITSNSNYILTYDLHLLKIKKFREINIIKPEELIL